MKRKKIVILPKLNDAGGDLSKKWFIYYSVRDPRTDKMKRFREHSGLSQADETERRRCAGQQIRELTEKLKRGWSPFLDDKEAIYEDQLQYKTVAEIMESKKLQMLLSDAWPRNLLKSNDRPACLNLKRFNVMSVNCGC
jgi:hypothetical protein